MGVRMRKREKSIQFCDMSYETRRITIISTSRRHAKYLEELVRVLQQLKNLLCIELGVIIKHLPFITLVSILRICSFVDYILC